MRFEHHIKRSRLAQRIVVRAFDAFFHNRRIHLFHGHAIRVNAVVLENMIGAVAAMIDHIFAQRIDEGIDMPARLPNFLVHQNRRIDAVDIVALINKPAPPQIHDITLQLHTQRAVIPRTAQTTIHIRTLINKAAALAQANNCFHFCLTHKKSPFSSLRW